MAKDKKESTEATTSVGNILNNASWWEKFEKSLIIIAMIFGVRKSAGVGEDGAQGKGGIPDWVNSMLPESFSIEDEAWRNIIVNSCERTDAPAIEREFAKRAKDKGYDMGEYRKRIMRTRKEFLEEMRKPNPKHDPDSKLKFDEIKYRDPCNAFLMALIGIRNRYGNTDEAFTEQEKIAVNSDYLVKIGGLKKAGIWIRENKGKTIFLLLSGIVISLLGSFTIFMLIIYAIFS